MHTCMLANAFSESHPTSALLMRKLLPRRLYPGRDRVGAELTMLRYSDDVDVFDGVDYYWVPSIFRALRFLWRKRPDVVVFQWWSGTVLHSFLAITLVARVLGAKIVIEFHETQDTAELAYPATAAYVRVASKPFTALAAAGAVHSSQDIEPIRDRFPALRDKPIAVVPVGAYNTAVDPLRWDTPRERNEPLRLLYFGTIRSYKGVENLIRAFDSLDAKQVQHYSLTVVGETWEGWTLPGELIEKSPYRDRISFVNTYVTDEQAADYFHTADAVVLPYLRSSASGPLHMAMSHGVPVAVTAVGGLVEAVQEYGGARLVKPDDVDDLREALLDLADMPGPYADPHSWVKSAEIMATVFDA